MEELIFTKYSNERSRRFAIRTDLLEEADGSRFVRKTPLYPEGERHAAQIARWYETLEELYGAEFFSFNRGWMEEKSVRLEYEEGKTLEELLDALCVQGDIPAAADKLRVYLEKVKKMYSGTAFVMTDGFREVFGEPQLPAGLLGAPVTDIDLVCSNVVLREKPVILDYEWTFEFPVPCAFVLYRIIRYCQDPYSARKPLCEVDFYREFGITEELQETFLAMELNFQAYITGGHVPMREMYDDMTPGNAPLVLVPAEELQVFFDKGEGYSQENSRRYPIKDKKVSVKVSVPDDCRRIRLDPGDHPCAVQVSRLAIDGEAVSLRDAVIEGGCRCGRWIYIAKEDPFIADVPVPEGARELQIRLHVYPVEPCVLEGIVRQNREKSGGLSKGRKLAREIKKRIRR